MPPLFLPPFPNYLMLAPLQCRLLLHPLSIQYLDSSSFPITPALLPYPSDDPHPYHSQPSYLLAHHLMSTHPPNMKPRASTVSISSAPCTFGTTRPLPNQKTSPYSCTLQAPHHIRVVW